jgi:hypothetical protein|tara:strand:- start:29287 stop:30054 length:768 start_codon:yes stop_codon:yes gene_type:complete
MGISIAILLVVIAVAVITYVVFVVCDDKEEQSVDWDTKTKIQNSIHSLQLKIQEYNSIVNSYKDSIVIAKEQQARELNTSITVDELKLKARQYYETQEKRNGRKVGSIIICYYKDDILLSSDSFYDSSLKKVYVKLHKKNHYPTFFERNGFGINMFDILTDNKNVKRYHALGKRTAIYHDHITKVNKVIVKMENTIEQLKNDINYMETLTAMEFVNEFDDSGVMSTIESINSDIVGIEELIDKKIEIEIELEGVL